MLRPRANAVCARGHHENLTRFTLEQIERGEVVFGTRGLKVLERFSPKPLFLRLERGSRSLNKYQIVFGQCEVRLELFWCEAAVKSSVSYGWLAGLRTGLIGLHSGSVTKVCCVRVFERYAVFSFYFEITPTAPCTMFDAKCE